MVERVPFANEKIQAQIELFVESSLHAMHTIIIDGLHVLNKISYRFEGG